MIEFENGFVCLKDEKGFWSENWDCAEEEIDSLIGRENETPVQADITQLDITLRELRSDKAAIVTWVVMQSSSDAVFAKFTDSNGNDDSHCYWWNEPLQGGSHQAW